jgi:hypothetical protein
MSTNLLALSGLQHAQIDLSQSATERRDDLLNTASTLDKIVDPIDADGAASILRDLHSLIKAVEESRKEVKAPVLDLASKIEATAKSFAAPLEEEKARLSRLLGAYQQAERDKAAEAVRKAQEEARRVAYEEAKKLAKVEAAHGIDSIETKAANDAAAEKVAEARVAVALVAPPQPKGTAVKRTWKFELQDIKALAAAHPELVVVSPNTAAINAVIKHNQSIPGLRVWEDIQTIIR